MTMGSMIKRGLGVAAAAVLATGATAALSTTTAEAAGDGRVTADGSLNVRYAPSKHAQTVGSIGSGKVIPLSCKSTGSPAGAGLVRTWYQLPGDGPPQWVSGAFVKEVGGTKVPWCSGGNQAKITVNQTLNVRHGPNTNDELVGELPGGGTATVVCKLKGQSVDGNNTWYLLPGSNWVSARYADNVGRAPGFCVER